MSVRSRRRPTGPPGTRRRFGFGPVTAVLLDAVIVRRLIVAAVMRLLGRFPFPITLEHAS
jgi:hypothetical protein